MRLSLYKKGMILLAVPFSLQLIFAALFALTYRDATEALKYQAARVHAAVKASEVAVLAMTLSADTYQSVSELRMESKRGGIAAVMSTVVELQNALDELKEVGHPYEDLVASTGDIAKLMKGYIVDTSNQLLGDGPLSKTFFEEHFKKHIKSTRQGLLDRLSALSELPSGPSLDAFTKSNRLETFIGVALLISILTNLACCAALWSIIRRSVVANISRMDENFQRLARNQELLPLVEGSDEFADFDTDFHEIAREVTASRAERHQYLELMSSSMREPLIELSNFIARLERGEYSTLNQRAQKMIAMTSQSTRRLVLMLNELIDFEQIEQGVFVLSKTSWQAANMAREAIDSVAARAEGKNIQIAMEVPEDLVLEADSDRLIRVLINLLTNAIKFSPERTSISLTISQRESNTLFVVEDQGRGVPEDLLEKIFLRYEQVDQTDSQAQVGSGLGLAICKTIVEAHGGRIWAENTDLGAKFSFLIPAEFEKNAGS